MVEGRTLNVFRDIVVIVGILVICLCEMQAFTSRMEARREQAMRFALARQAVAQLDNVYKQMIAGKNAPEQMFRQTEILIEYQKLLLTMAYVPLPTRTPAPGAPASQTASPGAAPPAATPPQGATPPPGASK
jgi:hypothetical protein